MLPAVSATVPSGIWAQVSQYARHAAASVYWALSPVQLAVTAAQYSLQLGSITGATHTPPPSVPPCGQWSAAEVSPSLPATPKW